MSFNNLESAVVFMYVVSKLNIMEDSWETAGHQSLRLTELTNRVAAAQSTSSLTKVQQNMTVLFWATSWNKVFLPQHNSIHKKAWWMCGIKRNRNNYVIVKYFSTAPIKL